MNTILSKQKIILNKKNANLKKKYDLDCITKYNLNKDGTLEAYNKYKKLMTCNYQIIGTYNKKGCGIWRWAWGNKYIPYNLKKLSLNMMHYGDKFNDTSFNKPKIRGKKDWKKYLIYASIVDKSISGHLVYSKPRTSIDVYMVLKGCNIPSKKIKKSKKREHRIKKCLYVKANSNTKKKVLN